MTTATAQDLVPFTITLKEKAESSGQNGPDYKLTIDGGIFGSQHPQVIWGCSLTDGQHMTVGQSYAVLLQRGQLATKRDGTAYDGQKPWMWRWRWGGFSGAGAQSPLQSAPPPPRPAAPRPQPQERPLVPGGPIEVQVDPTRWSIERQVALKSAVEFAIARLAQAEKMETFHVLRMADYFFGWLQDRPLNYSENNEFAVDAEPSAASADTRASNPETPLSAKSDAEVEREVFGGPPVRTERDFPNDGAFLNLCVIDLGCKDKREIETHLGGPLTTTLRPGTAGRLAAYQQVKAAKGL